MESVDVLVIGAGVTGLASALSVAASGRSVCVLERHARPGLDTSTHNSGVIHAGMYYPAGSLKARLCVRGRALLYEFCAKHGVPHSRIGKLIVAHDAREHADLEALLTRGVGNGVEGLALVDADFIRAREPNVHATSALFSPDTGIVEAEALVKALLKRAEAAGAIFLQATPMAGADLTRDGMTVTTSRETIHARQVVNAAGLYADDVSHMLGGERFQIHPCRGEYAEFVPARRSIFAGLVYPLPHTHGLGVHLLKTVGGAALLGPTVKYVDRKDDYESARLPVEAFLEPAQRLLRGIRLEDLRASGSGIRAKLQGPGEPFADFLIRRDRVNPAVVQAAGIESPGLTSCLAVGELVARIVGTGD